MKKPAIGPQEILLAEENLQSFRKKRKISESMARKYRLFFVLRQLYRADRKIGEKARQTGLTPFHFLMSKSSRIYRRAFEVAEELKIEMRPVLKSPAHFLEEFQPLKASCDFPLVKSEMEWVLSKSPSDEAVQLLYQVSEYNFPVFHDVLHAIYFILIPHPRRQSLKNYYLFIEALAFVQELDLASELGPHMSYAMKAIKNVHRTFEGEWQTWNSMGDEERFCRAFLTCLGYLHELGEKELADAIGPKWKPVHLRSLRFSYTFMSDVTPPWLNTHDRDRHPIQRIHLKKYLGHQLLKMTDFSFKEICQNLELQKRLYQWNCELLK